MKHFKLNIAFFVAMLVAGITFTTKADFSGKRVITVCFRQISLTNVNCSSTATLNGTTGSPPGCAAAKTQVILTPYVTAASSPFPSEANCPPNVEVFCCAKVIEIGPTDPGYACAPFVDLGEGLRKYKVPNANSVYCKLQLFK